MMTSIVFNGSSQSIHQRAPANGWWTTGLDVDDDVSHALCQCFVQSAAAVAAAITAADDGPNGEGGGGTVTNGRCIPSDARPLLPVLENIAAAAIDGFINGMDRIACS